jgi:hypothetical protein
MGHEQTEDSWPVYEINVRSSKPCLERVIGAAGPLAALARRCTVWVWMRQTKMTPDPVSCRDINDPSELDCNLSGMGG